MPTPDSSISIANLAATQHWPSPPPIAPATWQTIASASPSILDFLHDELPQEPKKTSSKQKPITNVLMKQFQSYSPLKLNSKTTANFEKTHKPIDFTFCTNDALLGIEIEVENIHNQLPHPVAYWSIKNDGSLRNAGIECVSQPVTPFQVTYAIPHIYELLHLGNQPDFSNRTSTHIHLNCRDLTQNQVWNLVILYCIFEKHFYKFANTHRLNSIFCVPVYRSNILHMADDVIYKGTDSWSKYCGLNILPLVPNNVTGTYGTIEFRHLHGTNDQLLILNWIDTILGLYKLAQEMTKEELVETLKHMNTTSCYKSLYYRFLNKQKPLLESNKDFEDCISHVKRELFGGSYGQTLKISASSPYWIIAHELSITG